MDPTARISKESGNKFQDALVASFREDSPVVPVNAHPSSDPTRLPVGHGGNGTSLSKITKMETFLG
jgi:hypothetical protein